MNIPVYFISDNHFQTTDLHNELERRLLLFNLFEKIKVTGGSLVIGSRHTGIITNDINKSLEFYRDILGLNLIQDFHDNSEYINTITFPFFLIFIIFS